MGSHSQRKTQKSSLFPHVTNEYFLGFPRGDRSWAWRWRCRDLQWRRRWQRLQHVNRAKEQDARTTRTDEKLRQWFLKLEGRWKEKDWLNGPLQSISFDGGFVIEMAFRSVSQIVNDNAFALFHFDSLCLWYFFLLWHRDVVASSIYKLNLGIFLILCLLRLETTYHVPWYTLTVRGRLV